MMVTQSSKYKQILILRQKIIKHFFCEMNNVSNLRVRYEKNKSICVFNKKILSIKDSKDYLYET